MRLIEVATGISVNTDKIITVEKQENENDNIKSIIRLKQGIINSDLDYETIVKRVKGIE
jgi:hypothetical protein